MALTPGTSIGRYEVLGLLGSGGMGEVYRARDTQLHRDVALKVLPDYASTDSAAAARLDREAQAIARLNHPNICGIHDVGTDRGRRFLVMELLDGETLQQALGRGPFELPQLLAHGIALADALQAAYARGVIHRDLKPANIMLTTGGQLKVLDFGIASASSFSDTTRAADDAMTAAGTAVGTPAYMSPEQLRGEPLDARSDLFALGLVLYEMATARRAFTGKTDGEVAAAVLTADIPPLTAIRGELPGELARIVSKAVERDPELRYQTAADVRADLKRLQRELTIRPAATSVGGASDGLQPSTLAGGGASSSVRPSQQGRSRRHAAIGLTVACLAVIAAFAWLPNRGEPVQPAALDELQVQPLTLDGLARMGAISPDGRLLVYQRYDDGTIRTRQIASESDVTLLPPDRFGRVSSLTFTPDGNFVDVVATSGKAAVPDLWRVPSLGGTPRRLVRDVVSAIGWSPDGLTMAFVRFRMPSADMILALANADGGGERELVTLRMPQRFFGDLAERVGRPASRPSFAPDGGAIAIARYSVEEFGKTSEIVVYDTKTGAEERTLKLPGIWKEVAWIDNEWFLLVGGDRPGAAADSKLWIGDLNGARRIQLTREFGVFENLSITATRTTAVVKRFTRMSGIWSSDASGASAEMVIPVSPSGAGLPSLDAHGGLTYTAFKPDGANAIYHLPRGASRPILVVDETVPPFAGRNHDVSVDGNTIVYAAPHHPYGLFRVQNDGSESVELVPSDTREPRLTNDGKTVLFARSTPGLFSVPAAGGAVRQLTSDVIPPAPSSGRRSVLSISPDGTRLLIGSPEPGEVVLCDLPDCTGAKRLRLPSTDWAPSGTGVAYVRNGTTIVEQPLAGGEPRVIAQMQGPEPIINFRWSLDGSRLATSRGTYPNDLLIIRGLPSSGVR